MTLPVYITGTVSVSNLGTVVTGTGCMWSGINAREGDFFTRPDGVAIITEVTDATHLKITPWPGATIAGGAYAIEQNYVGRVVGVAAAEDVGVMLEKLHVDGLPFIVGADETVPDPSYGDEGQMAFKPDTGAWWVKSGGIWVPSYGLTALGYGGTSATSILIATGPATFTTQSGLAYNGARVRAASAANLNNWMEGVATYAGTALSMTADKIHGSGTHADWLLSIGGQPGLDGTGTGDMQAVNNLSELTATAPTARKNIYAAPFDALAYNGMQINGSMEVSQELGTAASTATAVPVYIVDGWTAERGAGIGTLTASQAAVAPNNFVNSIGMYVTTTPPANAAGEYAMLGHPIEGYRLRRLGFGSGSAQPVTIGFWVLSNTAGIVSVALRNKDVNRSYVTTVTIGSAAAWEYKTVTIPGDTTGTWFKDNNIGIRLSICASCGTGSLMTATPNVWQAGNIIAATGQANHLPAASQGLYITGVVVLPGIEAPTAARSPLIMRPYDQELVTCQRYWEQGSQVVIYYNQAGAYGRVWQPFSVTKRSAPTVNGTVPVFSNCTGLTLDNATIDGCGVVVAAVASGAVSYTVKWTADARL